MNVGKLRVGRGKLTLISGARMIEIVIKFLRVRSGGCRRTRTFDPLIKSLH
jgi:hypothetical protein